MRAAIFAVAIATALAQASALPADPATDEIRAEAMAEELAMNAPGTLAADFGMRLPDGASVRLSDFRGHPVLLILFDPDCDHCREVLDGLDATVPEHIDLLAVYADGEESLWPRAMEFATERRTLALDTTGVYTEGLYTPEFIPGLYLLDSEGIVIARSDSPSAIFQNKK